MTYGMIEVVSLKGGHGTERWTTAATQPFPSLPLSGEDQGRVSCLT